MIKAISIVTTIPITISADSISVSIGLLFYLQFNVQADAQGSGRSSIRLKKTSAPSD